MASPLREQIIKFQDTQVVQEFVDAVETKTIKEYIGAVENLDVGYALESHAEDNRTRIRKRSV